MLKKENIFEQPTEMRITFEFFTNSTKLPLYKSKALKNQIFIQLFHKTFDKNLNFWDHWWCTCLVFQAHFMQSALPSVLPWCMVYHLNTRTFATACLVTLWRQCEQSNLNDVIKQHAIVNSVVEFHVPNSSKYVQLVLIVIFRGSIQKIGRMLTVNLHKF